MSVLLPQPVRITTNKLAEHWVISPLLIARAGLFPLAGHRFLPDRDQPSSRAVMTPGYHPGRAGGLWLCSTFVLSGLHAVVVPSGFRTKVQPHR
jgi:hypothetical protein